MNVVQPTSFMTLSPSPLNNAKPLAAKVTFGMPVGPLTFLYIAGNGVALIGPLLDPH